MLNSTTTKYGEYSKLTSSQVVNQSVTMMQDLPAKLDHRMSLHILTEQRNVSKFQGRYHKHVVVHGVPESYIPPKAKYKARSLEWFRTNMVLQNEDWVLHLDEETVIDEYGLKACLDFVTRQTDADVGTVGRSPVFGSLRSLT